jgi:hypothetical protein
MPRSLKWIKSQNFQGFGCSECNWKFEPSGEPGGDSLDEMKRKYEAERAKAADNINCDAQPQLPNLSKIGLQTVLAIINLEQGGEIERY